MINRTLVHRYTLLEHVGSGGMADVYKAHDELLDRSVAVKILHSHFTHDEEFINRFRREAQAAAKLSHPNIVNIYDVGHDGGTYYIVMEYISGKTLKEWIQKETILTVETSLRIALEIAEALEHAHQNGLIHCDIKPHNIILTKNNRIKVTDFGIARAVTSTTMTNSGTVLGSVHYFSPEQARGISIGSQSDIYSLGVVLYEMLTGSVPFSGETPISIALKHLQEPPKPLTEVNQTIPPLVEAIVLKAMSKELSARYLDISEMIHDLRLAKNYLLDENTRRISRDDFPTQVLPKVIAAKNSDKINKDEQLSTELPVRSKNTNTKKLAMGLLLLLVLGFLTGAFLAYGKFWSSSEISVPDVTGKQLDIARTIIINQNLRVTIAEAFNDKVPSGYVISQNPEAGSIVKEQRSITLVISKGTEINVVPELRGLTRRDAELQLKNAGLLLGRVDEQYSNDTPSDTVISQSPRPTAQVNKNTAVDLIISKGPSPKKLILPDFRGMPLSAVSTQIDSLKLKLGTPNEAPSDKYQAGVISAQNPPPGTEIMEGSTVDITVSKGNGLAARRAVVQFVVPEGPIRQAIQIMVTDTNGRRVLYEGVHKPGDKIDKTVDGMGQMRIQIYVNGVLLQEQTV